MQGKPLMNQTVLMSDAQYFSAQQAINPYYSNAETDRKLAQSEHDSIRRAFEKAGIHVKQVASPATSQDGVYTANWALIRNNKAVIARLPNVRKSEENYAEVTLTKLGFECIHVPDNLRFSGQGDALPCGNYLFCGSGYRSDPAAQAFAADTLGFTCIQLQTVPQQDKGGRNIINAVSGWPDSFFYDIDLALAVLRPPTSTQRGLIAFCPEAFTDESQQTIRSLADIECIEVSLKEATQGFALNLVSTGYTVIMTAHAPKFQSKLQSYGFRILTPEVRELSKGGGYIRCTSLSLG